ENGMPPEMIGHDWQHWPMLTSRFAPWICPTRSQTKPRGTTVPHAGGEGGKRVTALPRQEKFWIFFRLQRHVKVREGLKAWPTATDFLTCRKVHWCTACILLP